MPPINILYVNLQSRYFAPFKIKHVAKFILQSSYTSDGGSMFLRNVGIAYLNTKCHNSENQNLTFAEHLAYKHV
jgi:hypothetical protein